MRTALLKNFVNCSLVLLAATGCSFQHLVVNKLGDAIAQGGKTYASDNDLELVQQATPFSLKLIEGLLEESPKHPGLLLAATRGFTQYSFAFVDIPAQETEEHNVAAAYEARERARKLYLRARNYGLRGLEVSYPGFATTLSKNIDVAIGQLQAKDAQLLYWTVAAWAAAISLSKDSPSELAGFPEVFELATRLIDLDETFGGGSIHVLYISLLMNQSLPMRDRLRLADEHFNRALTLSSGHQASLFVTYAEAVSIATGNRGEFDRLLDQAINVDFDAEPSYRLANELFRRRAIWLRAHGDEFFRG